MALVHSGKLQSESDPFMVHNHTTENNNTVWVRQESGWLNSYYLESDNSPLNSTGFIKWSHSWRGCGAESNLD